MMMKDFESAKKCLDKEASQNQIARSSLAADFEKLKSSISTLPALLAQAGRLLTWGSGQGDVHLVATDSAAVGEIRTLKEQLEKAEPSKMGSLSDQLKGRLLAVCQAELGNRRDFASGLPSGLLKLDASSCAAPRNAADIEAAYAGLETCERTMVSAMRQAGASECGGLGQLRAAIEKSQRDLLAWSTNAAEGRPAAPAPLPAAPQICSSARWNDATVADLRTAIGELGRQAPEYRAALEKRAGETNTAMARSRNALQAEVKQAYDRIPSIPAQCAQTLRLRQAETGLGALKSRLDPAKIPDKGAPPEELFRASELVDEQINALVGLVRQGVDGMIADKNECPEVAAANLDALPAARDTFVNSKRPGDLDALCARARSADQDIQTCWANSTGLVTRKVQDAVGLLRIADQDSGCLRTSLVELQGRVSPGRTDPARWSRETREALTAAETCLQEWHARTESECGDLTARVTRVSEPLQALGSGNQGGNLSGSLGDSVARMTADIAGARSILDNLAPLCQPEPQNVTEQNLKGLMAKAGLEERVPDTAWQQLGQAASGADPKAAVAVWKTIRDAAVGPELDRAATTLARWEPVTAKLNPFFTLSGAFSSFAAGDLDGAIRVLRASVDGGEAPPEGKGAAMIHASLSYFLFTKLKLSEEGKGGDVARLLGDDARREATRACQADPLFELPESLFKSESFRDMFRACTQAANL